LELQNVNDFSAGLLPNILGLKPLERGAPYAQEDATVKFSVTASSCVSKKWWPNGRRTLKVRTGYGILMECDVRKEAKNRLH
jgi:hypothetical protein